MSYHTIVCRVQYKILDVLNRSEWKICYNHLVEYVSLRSMFPIQLNSIQQQQQQKSPSWRMWCVSFIWKMYNHKGCVMYGGSRESFFYLNWWNCLEFSLRREYFSKILPNAFDGAGAARMWFFSLLSWSGWCVHVNKGY